MSLVRGSAFVTGGGPGGGPAYVASKHGVVGLTRQLAITFAARGVGDRELAGEADDAVLGGDVRGSAARAPARDERAAAHEAHVPRNSATAAAATSGASDRKSV